VAAYRIRFLKRLKTRRERATEPCVWSVNVRVARDFIRDLSAAKRRFERFVGVANGRSETDYISADARPLSGEKGQDVGQWPSYLKFRMDMMQKNLAVGAQTNPRVPLRREMGREAEEPEYGVHVPHLSSSFGCNHPTCRFGGFIGIYDYSNPRSNDFADVYSAGAPALTTGTGSTFRPCCSQGSSIRTEREQKHGEAKGIRRAPH
jgi:hypothetical protein